VVLGAGVVTAAMALLAPAAGAAVDPIPDAGLPAELAPALVSTTTTPLQAGVSGVLKVGDSDPLVDTPVQAMAEGDGVMYVGGKFAQVVNADGTTGAQSYLAAFDLTTGAWIDTFRPQLDGTVWDLAVTPSGRLIVGGQFTNVNGVAGTSALAMLDPVTGAVVTTWRADAVVTGTTARPSVRAIDIEGPWVYVGGNFTRLTSLNGVAVPEARLGRVALANGTIDKSFRPNIGGVIYDIDATPDRVHAVGKFTTVNGVPQVAVAVLDPNTGDQLPGMATPVFTDATLSRRYYFAVKEVGDRIWLGGSQHTTQVYRRSDYSLVRSFVANPNGDGQALAVKDGIVYAGNHSNDRTLLYSDATTWPGLAGATRSDPITWIGAWDDATQVFQNWVPDVGSTTGEGTWDLQVDSTGCLWGGGDYDRGSIVNGVPTFAQGFAKFCGGDRVAPTVPGSPTATTTQDGVSLGWTASTDAVGVAGYEIFRNDQSIATGVTGTLYFDTNGVPGDRYFVRAVDATGNKSATTSVIVAPARADTSAPTAPTGLTGSATGATVNLSWSASNDDVGVTGYVVQRNGTDLTLAAGTTASIPSSPVGSADYTIIAVDAAGNRSLPSNTVTVTVVAPPPPPPTDTVKPTSPTGLAGTNPTAGTVVLTWNPAVDNVGVTGYTVLRNGVEVGQVTTTTATLVAQPTAVTWYQVVARDAAGNQSVRTAPLALTVLNGPDTQAPTAPKGLTVANGAPAEVLLSWNASADNLGVVSYAVLRNGVELSSFTTTSASITGVAPGTWWFQVVARDAAGNTSVRTAPVQVVVTDRSAPTAPTLVSVALDTIGNTVVTWTASTDDVGVVAYVVLQDGVEVQRLPITTFTSLVSTSHALEIRAVDAAGNLSEPLLYQLTP
jgi:chitodextrinase